MPCFVCESTTIDLHEHHIVQRSRNGVDLNTVKLCPSCHQTTHSAAHKALSGKSYDVHLAHLSEPARLRLDFLVKAIIAVEAEEQTNPHPIVTVVLEDRRYLDALNMEQKDRGFSSREKFLNSLFREMAITRGLMDEEKVSPKRLPLSELRNKR